MTINSRHKLLLATACVMAPAFASADVNIGLFESAAQVQPPEIVDCTLENGTTTQCVRMVVKYLPDDLETGPFCPATVGDAGGIWQWTGEDAGLYRIDAAFLNMMSGLGYTFFDDQGNVYVTDPRLEQPGADNSCLSASLDDTVEMTITLPLSPVRADAPTPLGTVAKVGLGLDGVPIFADAPSIQQTGHMPALDVCGGHVDPGGWYHWHATASDITGLLADEGINVECAVEQNAAALFGYAFDGFAMYGTMDADGTVPNELDDCNGHVSVTEQDPEGSYHYHATPEFPNLPACLTGVVAENNFSTTASSGIGSANGGSGPGGMPPGMAEAAMTLGVTEDALQQALEASGGRRLDVAAAAAILGVSEDLLRKTLPSPPGR